MPRPLTLALVALALSVAGLPGGTARAERLGGNYRGPADRGLPREDGTPPAPGEAPDDGEGGGEPAPPAGGGEEPPAGGGEAPEGNDPGSGGGDSGDGNSTDGGGGSYRGPAGEGPPPAGGGESGSEGGGGATDGGGGAAAPEGGGGGSSGSGGGGSTPGAGGSSESPGTSPPAGGNGAAGSAPAGGGAGKPGGKTAVHDDRDRIWPFYFEAAREEYLALVFRRRADERISPPRSSTFLLSTLPEPRAGTKVPGEGDRARVRALLRGRLADPDSRVRDAALLALGKAGGLEVVPFLARTAFTDADHQVREDAFLALGLSGDREEALPALLWALREPPRDPRERRVPFAALGLGLLGDAEGVAPLRALYRDACLRPRVAEEAACAAVALAMLGDGDSVPLFEKVVLSRGAPEATRAYTLHALGKLGSHADAGVRRRALAAVVAALREKSHGVHRAAVLALGSFDDPAALRPLTGNDGLSHPDSLVKTYAAHALGRIAARLDRASPAYAAVQEALGEAAGSDRKDRWLSQAGTIALASLPGVDREADFLARLRDGREVARGNPHTVSSVVVAVGLRGDRSEEAARTLREVFRSRAGGTGLRAYAGLALAMAGGPGAAEEIGGVFRTEGDRPAADLARVAALSLGLVGGPEESRLLVEVLQGRRMAGIPEESRGFLLGAAVQGIGLIGDAGSVELLEPLLESRDGRTRAFATAALGYLAEPDPVRRASPRISEIFRHHDYSLELPVVRAVMSTL